MKLASGVTDQYIYFAAVASTDHITPKTGLSTFTAYRSRNGGSATAYTTPTITELNATNMPGLYKFLIDEDTTIDAGDETQEYAVTIKATGMDNVHRVIELFRPKITIGDTLVTSGGAVTTVTTTTTATNLTNAPTNGDLTATMKSSVTAAVPTAAANAAAALTTQMTESYAANGVAPTLAQALFAVHQMLMDFGISSTSYTVKKLNNTDTAFVVTLDSATTPTAAART